MQNFVPGIDRASTVRGTLAPTENEEYYRRLVGLLPVAVYTCTAPSGLITFYNQQAVILWGRAPRPGDTDERFCGSHRLWRADGTLLPHDETPMALALREGRPFRNEDVVIERPDGSRISVLVNIDPIVDAEGRVTAAINAFHDTTALKRAEEVQHRLAAIVESSDDAIISQDMNGTIMSWNRGAESLYGYTAAEVVGKPVSILIPADHTKDFTQIMQRLRRGERIEHYETVRVARCGRRVDVSLTISPLRNAQGRVVGVSKIARDISERKRAEAALRSHGERMRVLWEGAGVLLTSDEPDAMLQQLFAKIGASLGLDVYFNYMVTEAGDALRLVSCAGIPDEIARSISRLELGQGVSGVVALRRKPIVATRIQQSDEPMVQVVKRFGIRAYACSPLLAGGQLLGTLSFASRSRDAFEQEEIEFLQTIAHYVAAAYERLRLIEQLRHQDRLKDEFLATLAHELRNPLAPIRNGVQLIRLGGNNPALLERAYPMMERQLQQMVRLVDDLLDVSRISRNRLELRKEWVDLATVVQSAVETSRPLIEAAAHELTVTLPPEPILLEADAIRLAQAFANLLNNAAKYTERGGRIWLSAELADEANESMGVVIVRVRDTGVGIPADKLRNVFEMFEQVDRSLDRSQGGLGIGLTLVQRLIQLHGGRVDACSDGPGKGSEFIVRLPGLIVRRQEAAQQAAEGTELDVPQIRRRILVVDDNRDSADTLAMTLKVLGHEVATANDGLEALERAQALQPDVALLDLGMPGMNGYDAARRIREQPWGRRVMLVALTGWSHDEDRRRSQQAGFDAHLVKPVELAALEKLLVAAPTATPSPDRSPSQFR